MKKTGIELNAQERKEQNEKHGRTIEKDVVTNPNGSLSRAARAILSIDHIAQEFPKDWIKDFLIKVSRKKEIEKLVIAGALIAAEIDRLQALEG